MLFGWPEAIQTDLIVKFEGCYHGHSDSLLVKAGSGALTLGVPSSPGVPAALAFRFGAAPYLCPLGGRGFVAPVLPGPRQYTVQVSALHDGLPQRGGCAAVAHARDTELSPDHCTEARLNGLGTGTGELA